ncbi:Prolyl 4-hydroxylase subunit alpha-1 [Bulinus truncatus]|nr:Prolyl 4-hydroxylase subunit alpha-1 [Bulinus truncatus]
MSYKKSASTTERNKTIWIKNLVQFHESHRKRRTVPLQEQSLEDDSRIPLKIQIVGRYLFLAESIRREGIKQIIKEVTGLWQKQLNFCKVVHAKLDQVLKTFDIYNLKTLKLARSTTGAKDPQASPIRISHTAFLTDFESEIATFISKRISYLTILEAGPYAAEDHEIVNHGLGGYYNLHQDTFDHVDKGSHTQYVLDNFGNCLATFLIYKPPLEVKL